MNSKKVLIIGGTGILGKAVITESLKENAEIFAIGLSKNNSISKRVKQIVVDRKDTKKFSKLAKELNDKIKNWGLVLDVADFEKKDAEQTYNSFKDSAKHFFIMSTTLIYDRSKPNYEPIKSKHPLAKKGQLGGYVDNKLDIENFWQQRKDVNWTIFRPYHILSPEDSLLGCIPDHNRDPKLIERIRNNEPLVLCNEGNMKFNFVDARDVAKAILKAAGNPKTYHKAYNVVNPTTILAKDYYDSIGKELRKKVIIKNKSIEEVWKENKGWQLTTLPHLYDVSDLQKDINFVPEIPLRQTIKETFKLYKPVQKPTSEIPVHQRMTLPPRPKPINWLLENNKPKL